MRGCYNIILFTASEKDYADAVLDVIDPQNKYFAYRMYRYDCIKINKNILLKDLEVS